MVWSGSAKIIVRVTNNKGEILYSTVYLELACNQKKKRIYAMQHFQSRLQHNSCYHDHPSKKFCPNHSTPPTIATIFADFVLDNPATVSEDEAAPGEVEDANAPGDVEA